MIVSGTIYFKREPVNSSIVCGSFNFQLDFEFSILNHSLLYSQLSIPAHIVSYFKYHHLMTTILLFPNQSSTPLSLPSTINKKVFFSHRGATKNRRQRRRLLLQDQMNNWQHSQRREREQHFALYNRGSFYFTLETQWFIRLLEC